MSRPVVIVMLKAPRAGLVKTRLSPPLAPAAAAALAACFAQDVVQSAQRATGELIIAYAPAGGRATLETLLRGRFIWLAQQGAGLGARLAHAAAQAFKLGCGPLVIIGADSPTLPPAFITQALQALAADTADIVLGPTTDGGYYLIGLRGPAPALWQNVEWSSPRTYAQTARNAARLGLRLHALPPWYDVDTPADLVRLRAEIFSDEAAQRRAPATYQWLRRQDDQDAG